MSRKGFKQKYCKGTFFPSIFVTHDSVYITDLNGMLDHYITGQATLRVGDWSLFFVQGGGRGKGEGFSFVTMKFI